MFVSFFPKPRLFFVSAGVWSLIAILLWYAGGDSLGAYIGLPPLAANAAATVGVAIFWSPAFLWFYVYYVVALAVFAGFWFVYSPHRWQSWSVLGTALIVFNSYFSVQVSVAINAWYGPFYDMIQRALEKTASVTAAQLFNGMLSFAGIAFLAVTVGVLNLFFVSHWIFRWRTAMNEYYIAPIVAGKLTLGLLTQITNVFDQVRNSFQYLVNSWTTIVELISIYKRLRTFEATLSLQPLPPIDREYLTHGEAA